jgi:hypothetical protein
MILRGSRGEEPLKMQVGLHLHFQVLNGVPITTLKRRSRKHYSINPAGASSCERISVAWIVGSGPFLDEVSDRLLEEGTFGRITVRH